MTACAFARPRLPCVRRLHPCERCHDRLPGRPPWSVDQLESAQALWLPPGRSELFPPTCTRKARSRAGVTRLSRAIWPSRRPRSDGPVWSPGSRSWAEEAPRDNRLVGAHRHHCDRRVCGVGHNSGLHHLQLRNSKGGENAVHWKLAGLHLEQQDDGGADRQVGVDVFRQPGSHGHADEQQITGHRCHRLCGPEI